VEDLDQVSTVTSERPEGVSPAFSTNGSVNLLDLLIMVAKHKRMVVWVTAAAAVLSIVVSLLLPNTYRATTQIMPPKASDSAVRMMMGQLGALTGLSSSNFGLRNPEDIYVAILGSRTIADALVQRFDLMHVYGKKRLSDARKRLANDSEIFATKDGVIVVSVESTDPGRAADMANTYVTELKTLNQSLAVSEAGQRRLFFEQQLNEAKEDLAAAEVALRDTQEKTGLIAIDSQAKAIIESMAALRGQIAAKEVELKASQTYATSRNPQVILLQQELAGLRGQLAQLERKSAQGKGDVMVPTSAIPSASVEYVRRLREVKYRETLFELLAKQYEAAKLDESKSAAVIQVIDPVVPPDRKSGPFRSLIVLVTCFLAFFIACVAAILKESFSRPFDPAVGARLQALKFYLVGR
jgi:uncharacterized protein involved in exopolysaccharide biosynthesis